jgi:hypothetical protein
MKHRWGLAVIAANLAAIILLAVLYPDLMVGPGPLMPAHQALSRDCFACHVPFGGAAPQRCIACHVPAEIGLRTTAGAPIAPGTERPPFHQALASQDCLACHSDHPSPGFTEISRTRFSHALLDRALAGRCASCHKPPADALHSDPGADCGQCHGQKGWLPARFDHDRHFVLDGPHDVPCGTCHASNQFSRYTCYGCHAHRPEAILAEHREEGIGSIDDCVACHRRGHAEDGEDDWLRTR